MEKRTQKLKIALLVDHFLPQIGGIELHVRDLAFELKHWGHEVQVITPTPGENFVGEIPIRRLKTSLLPGANILWNLKPFRQLKKMIQHEGFDLLHIHSSVMSPFAYGSILFFKEDLPTVLTTHSLLNNTARVFRGLHTLSKWGDWPVVLSGVSRSVADSLAKASGRSKTHVLPNGIDLSPWEAIVPETHPGLRVTTVMRLHRKKRPKSLMRAVPKILSKVKDPDSVCFTFLGDGPERKELKAMATNLKIEKNVEILGYQPRDVIRKVFAQTDIFALPTLKEAFGIALLEARAAGLPIVAMNRGGTGDLIQDGQEGFLAETDQDFEDRIAQLLQDPDLRRTMAAKARDGLKKFAWDSVIERHLDLYQGAFDRFADHRLKTGKKNEGVSDHRYGAGLPSLPHDLPGN